VPLELPVAQVVLEVTLATLLVKVRTAGEVQVSLLGTTAAEPSVTCRVNLPEVADAPSTTT